MLVLVVAMISPIMGTEVVTEERITTDGSLITVPMYTATSSSGMTIELEGATGIFTARTLRPERILISIQALEIKKIQPYTATSLSGRTIET